MRRVRHGIVSRLLLWMALGSGFGWEVGASSHAGEWVLPDDRLGIRTAPLLLLTRPDVQSELGLERQTIQGAHDTINELTRRAAALRGKTGAAVVSERRAIDEAQLEWLGKNLTGKQLDRLQQVEIQWEGIPAMLSRPTVAEYMRLTSEQRQSLASLIADQNAARRKGPVTPAAETTFRNQAYTVLSKGQQELWVQLLGSPVRFASSTAASGNRDDATQRAGYASPRK